MNQRMLIFHTARGKRFDLRDPAAALPIAQRAVEKSGGKDPASLDTLALAYFLTGDAVKAIETEEKALSLLPPGDSSLRKDLEKSLARFRGAATSQPTTEQAKPADSNGN